jgi:hypothetical protein
MFKFPIGELTGPVAVADQVAVCTFLFLDCCKAVETLSLELLEFHFRFDPPKKTPKALKVKKKPLTRVAKELKSLDKRPFPGVLFWIDERI